MCAAGGYTTEMRRQILGVSLLGCCVFLLGAVPLWADSHVEAEPVVIRPGEDDDSARRIIDSPISPGKAERPYAPLPPPEIFRDLPTEAGGVVLPGAVEAPDPAEPMTAERLWALLEREKLSPEREHNQVVFYVGNVRVFSLVDPQADRMRFMVPVRKLEDVPPEELLEMLKANYAATVDLRFAVNRDVVWLLFLHPLSSLTEGNALSAINQLAHHAQKLVAE